MLYYIFNKINVSDINIKLFFLPSFNTTYNKDLNWRLQFDTPLNSILFAKRIIIKKREDMIACIIAEKKNRY